MTPTIRPAQLADMPPIGAIYVSGHSPAYRGSVPYSSLRALDSQAEAQSLAVELDKPNSVFLVAVNTVGRVIGFAFVGMTDHPRLAGLAELHVERRYRRRYGVGSFLAKAAAREFAARGADTMTAIVAQSNHPSRAFCAKLGATEENLGDTMPLFAHDANVPTVPLPLVHVHWNAPTFANLIN